MSSRESIRYFTAASPKSITPDCSLYNFIIDDTSQGPPKHIKIPIELVPNELASPVPAWPLSFIKFVSKQTGELIA